MICEDVRAALGAGEICEESDAGARVVTHCLYPSFTPVSIFVTKLGDGYRITDGGGALRNAWVHGREEKMLERILAREASRFHLKVSNGALVADAPSIDWLRAAVLAVANASASAAHAAIGKAAAATERALKDRIYLALSHVAPERAIGTDVQVIGASGDIRSFDYGVRIEGDGELLVSAVAPHHSSIYAKYVAFADTKELPQSTSRFAVYDRPLNEGDVSLMLQVAELVPLQALDTKARRVLLH